MKTVSCRLCESDKKAMERYCVNTKSNKSKLLRELISKFLQSNIQSSNNNLILLK